MKYKKRPYIHHERAIIPMIARAGSRRADGAHRAARGRLRGQREQRDPQAPDPGPLRGTLRGGAEDVSGVRGVFRFVVDIAVVYFRMF